MPTESLQTPGLPHLAGPTEEDLLDMQENLSRDPRLTRRFNYLLTLIYLLIAFLVVAGIFTTWQHHWLVR